MQIKGLDFQLTCVACPEQYDVFLDEQQVGYVRLRYGRLTACLGEVGGELIYDYDFTGFESGWLGVFPNSGVREAHLNKIADCIINRYSITYLQSQSKFEDEEPDSI